MKEKETTLRLPLLSAALAAGLAGLSSCVQDSRPNFLILLADDYGAMDTGAGGSSFYETPNIDRIAAEGVIFRNGYAPCTVSSPSRASLLTGLYTTRHGITEWIGEASGEDWRRYGRFDRLLPADYAHNLDTEKFPCLPQVLKDHGYSTFMAGKWHLGQESTPEKAGFGQSVAGYAIGQPPGGYFSPYNNPRLEDGPPGEELSMRLSMEAGRFLREHRKKHGKRKPFFVYLPYYAVHTPVQTTRERWEHFRDKAEATPAPGHEPFTDEGGYSVCQVQDNPVFAGLVSQMDDAVGWILRELRRLGYERNTIVFFLSDNGGLSSMDYYSTSNYPLRGGKSFQWEGGVRIPFFVRVPGASGKGAVLDTPVNLVDIYPTLLDYAGIESETQLDGVSIRPLLEGGTIAERPMFWHYPHYGGGGGAPSSMVREGDWKLIFYHEDGHCELYNLASDPSETTDVSASNPETADLLYGKLAAWLEESGAKMPVPDPQYDAGAHSKVMEQQRESMRRGQEHNRKVRLQKDFSPGADWWGSAVRAFDNTDN